MIRECDLGPYLRGERLWGDDFDASELAAWFEGEREGYASLDSAPRDAEVWEDGPDHSRDPGRYTYHALNRRHGFRHLGNRRFRHALGIGSFRGSEFAPIAARVDRLTILEPSDAAPRDEVVGIPTSYVKPEASGVLPFEDAAFDLMTAFGVLHHIPNVSFVVGEMRRCLAPGGFALVREPVVSMGDWRAPRPGLTANERGIPLQLFARLVERAGFRSVHQAVCLLQPLNRVARRLGRTTYAEPWLVLLDDLLSRCLRWNVRYHRTRPWHKLAPGSVFYVLTPA